MGKANTYTGCYRKYTHVWIFLTFFISVFLNAKGWYEQTQSLLRENVHDDSPVIPKFSSTQHRSQAKLRDALKRKRDQPSTDGISNKRNSVGNAGMNLVAHAVAVEQKQHVTLHNNITSANPVFVLSLPHSGSLTMDRYFKCAGLDEDTLGRRWTKKHRDEPVQRRVQLGTCMDRNVRKQNEDPLFGCGDYRVWMELESSPRRSPKKGTRQCFFPTLRPDVLGQLFRRYPQATVINVRKDPEEWYASLPTTLKERWYKWCNEGHDNVFPPANATKAEWMQVYEQYHSTLRETIRAHLSVTYIEIVLDDHHDVSTATELEERLGVRKSCWIDVARNPVHKSDIGLPIFNLGLPKSATSTAHGYLNCGLGPLEGGHQWIVPDSNRDGTTERTVAHCMQRNLQNDRPIVEGCGDTLHFSDVGVMRTDGCFYPSMDRQWLDAMYRDHPYGTIMNVVRDATVWYQSALKWNNLTTRWSKNCGALGSNESDLDFPLGNATAAEWVFFYNQHTQRVRDFATAHPSLTYVEVSLENEEQRQQVLGDSFGFSSSCWGHKNNNMDGSSLKKRYG